MDYYVFIKYGEGDEASRRLAMWYREDKDEPQRSRD